MTWTDENGLKYSFNDSTATVDLSQYKGQENILIPRNVKYNNKEYVIVNIANNDGKTKIKCIDFSDDSQVSSFSKIYVEKLFIPPFVDKIEANSIHNSSVLHSVEFKKNSKIKFINMVAFKNSQMTQITFPSSVTEIDGRCSPHSFIATDLPKLVEVKFEPNSKLQKINCYSFKGSSMKQITIPPSVKEICNYAFNDCKQLESIDFLGNSELRYIGYGAFSNTNINKITIPSSVKEICNYAFNDCKQLDSIDFPNNSELKKIGNNAFSNTNIKNIKIPSQVDELDKAFFFGASQLNTIDVSEGNSHYSIINGLLVYHKEQVLFANKNQSSFIIPQSIKEISMNSFENCKNLKELIINENSELEIIRRCAFMNSAIEKISLPIKLKKIEYNAFKDCKNLRLVEISPNCELFLIENNVFQSSGIEKFDFTSHIIQIGSNVFDNCSKLASVAFLKSNLKSIGNCSFQSSSITEIVIPSSVKQIGEYSFNKCESLKIITFKEDSNLRYIEQYTFNSVNQLEEIIIPPKVREIGKNAFENCSKLKKVEFLDNSELNLIDDYAFKKTSLDTISIGSKVKRIGIGAFDSAKLNSIQFKDAQNSELKLIDKYSFKNCRFTQISIPPSVQIIEDHAFNCPNLNTINFDENSQLKTLGNSLFNSTNIESIEIPSQVDDIRDKCFENAYKLKSIIIKKENEHYSFLPEGMLLYKENIKSSIFDTLLYVNPNLNNIKIPSNIKHISLNAILNNHVDYIEFSKGCEVDFIHRNLLYF